MKRISMIAVAATVAAILACGGGDDDGGGDDFSSDGTDGTYSGDDGSAGGMTARDLPTVPMTQPWTGMNLPASGGNVVVSDSSVLLVAYDGGSIDSYASSYGSAVEKAGWTKDQDYSTPEFKAILFKKGDGELGMASGMEEGITFVYFENLKEVSEKDSQFSAARKGNRPSMRSRVKGKHRSGGAKRGGGGGGGGKKGGKKGKKGGKRR